MGADGGDRVGAETEPATPTDSPPPGEVRDHSIESTTRTGPDDAESTDPDDAPASDPSPIDELTKAVDRLTDRVRADQDVIGRMQSRIESLQADQVRALLGPAVTELANLHADFAESASRDYERLGLDRVRKELTLLADRIENAIDLLGASSIDARVGDEFDSRAHQAVKQVPTGDASKDKTIAAVVRQGFTFDAEGRPALHARVHVYSYDQNLVEAGEVLAPPLDIGSSDPAQPVDDELALPFPLDPK